MRFCITLLFLAAASLNASAQSVVLDGTTLRITGTAQDDSVRVSRFDGDVIAEIFGDGVYVFDVFQDFEVTRVVCSLRGGNDTYDGSDSINPSRIFGGSGNDLIFASLGNDRIVGGSGNDTIFGYSGNDNINGNGGDDYIDGGSGNDIARGDNGRDFIAGGSGLDQVIGGDGQDVLVGGELDAGYVANSYILESWSFGADDTFDVRVDQVLYSSPVLYNDFEVDFVSGGKEADLFFDQGDTIITDGVGWPSTLSPPAEGDREDIVL